jgi:hypothetical protein
MPQLASELIGRQATDAEIELLEHAAAFPREKPGNLLARLRNVRPRGRRHIDVIELAEDIRRLYWL